VRWPYGHEEGDRVHEATLVDIAALSAASGVKPSLVVRAI
jgi:hypothetical protein